jgi:hypothetical protein
VSCGDDALGQAWIGAALHTVDHCDKLKLAEDPERVVVEASAKRRSASLSRYHHADRRGDRHHGHHPVGLSFALPVTMAARRHCSLIRVPPPCAGLQ